AYAGVLDRLLAGDPEVVIAASYPGNATVFMQEARDLYGFSNWMMTDGTKSIDIVSALGADAVEGLYGTAPGADPQWEGYVRFSAAYEAAYGERPPPRTPPGPPRARTRGGGATPPPRPPTRPRTVGARRCPTPTPPTTPWP